MQFFALIPKNALVKNLDQWLPRYGLRNVNTPQNDQNFILFKKVRAIRQTDRTDIPVNIHYDT